MSNEATFSPDKINAALAVAQQHAAKYTSAAVDHTFDLSSAGELSVNAECVRLTVQNGQICVNLPFNLGHVCLPIPRIFPDGTAAEACLSICTTLGFPTGVKVTVSVLGNVVITKSFGKC